MASFGQLIHLQYLEKFVFVSRRYFSMTQERQSPAGPRDDRFDIVQVIGGFKLLDGMSRERTYSRRDRVPLAPGFYFVKIPPATVAWKFSEEAVFCGPYRRRQEAGDALERFKARVTFRNRRQWGIPDRPRVSAYRGAPASPRTDDDSGRGRVGAG
jgi:hypothetical protein